jgi:hypothetical protein
MASFKTTEFDLGADVADDGTVTGIAYPTGTTQASFISGNASATGVVFIQHNDEYREADTEIGITYGASTITLTNLSGVTWPAGASVTLQLGYASSAALVTDITATAVELNVLDGFAGTTQELVNAADLSARQRAVVATVAGATTGLLTVADIGGWINVTSANADYIVMLPAAGADYIGGKIEGWVGANGFEFRANGTAATINGLDCKTTNELAVPATHRFRLTLVAAETWLYEGDTELGARVTAVPDSAA